MLFKTRTVSTLIQFNRSISLSACLFRRPPPKEEFKDNALGRRKPTAEPYIRMWRLTSKSAEPYNKRGGNVEWIKMTKFHRGVQPPGYIDPKTKKFIFVEEMVPEIILPKNLNECNLKPYVPYNVEDLDTPEWTAEKLFEETYAQKLVDDFNKKKLESDKQLKK